MMGKIKLIWAALCLAILRAPSPAQAGPAESLDAYFAALAERRAFSGAVLVVDRGRVVFERAYGQSRLEPAIPMSPDSRFPYASVSKLFVATAILQLAEQRKLSLDAPVRTYLPRFPHTDITLRNLLNHSSGLSPFGAQFAAARQGSPTRVFTNADLVEAIAGANVVLLYSPGTRSNYDNINFALLALVIEQASGQAYPDYIRNHILRPAGMNDTRFVPVSAQMAGGAARADLVTPYVFPTRYAARPLVGQDIPRVRDYWGTYALTGFGDFTGTMRDLMRFAAAYDRLLGPGMRAQAFTVSRMAGGEPHPNKIGLSWYIGGDDRTGKLGFHAGASVGLSSIMVRNLDRDQTIILFSNMQPDVNGIAFDAMRLLNGIPVELARRSLARAYVLALLEHGPGAAAALLHSHRSDPAYVLDEDELNRIGYDLLRPADPYNLGLEPKPDAALEVFRTNLALHPGSWNAHDSYAEALRQAGRRAEAIAMYERSLALHDNPAGRRALAELRAGH